MEMMVIHQVLKFKNDVRKYVSEHGFTIYDYYIDDGYSGLNFERPAFKRLMQDISEGKVNLVITKDLSRLGRNHIPKSYFIEIFFPDNDIRYIAVNDNVDTLYDNNDIAPFKNILNDMCTKDTSRKVKTAKRLLMQKVCLWKHNLHMDIKKILMIKIIW